MNIIKYLLGILVLMGPISCKKYLNKIPDKSLTVPSTLSDFRALLDNDFLNNYGPGLLDLGTDNYYMTYTSWLSQQTTVRNAYIWSKDIFEGSYSHDWDYAYKVIYTTNVVLEGLEDLKNSQSTNTERKAIKGTALFFRAFNFYQLQEAFGQPYKSTSADKDLGIILRLSSKLEDKVKRSSVEKTYQQIIDDLNKAKNLLPNALPGNSRNRPSKAAVFALLAKTYLNKQDYIKAEAAADSCLALYSSLLDYNTLDTSTKNPFPYPHNKEVIFRCAQINWGLVTLSVAHIDPELYTEYEPYDLRKYIFFTSNGSFKNQYTGQTAQFIGLATDEIYLIASECAMRNGNKNDAIQILNSLLEKRYQKGKLIPITLSNSNILERILLERRKELPLRGVRWSDLRRLNQESQSAKTLIRNINGKVYRLLPNDPRYAYPIPDDEIRLSGLRQNER